MSKKDDDSKKGLQQNKLQEDDDLLPLEQETEDLNFGNEGGETLFLQLPKLMKSAKSHKPRINKRTCDSPVNKLVKKKSVRRDAEISIGNDDDPEALALDAGQESMNDMFTEDT